MMLKQFFIAFIAGVFLSSCGQSANEDHVASNAKDNVRIAVASFAMETCTFCPRKTDIEHFEYYGAPYTGADVLDFDNAARAFSQCFMVNISMKA